MNFFQNKKTRLKIIAATVVVACIGAGFLFAQIQSQKEAAAHEAGFDTVVAWEDFNKNGTDITLTFAGDCTLGTDASYTYHRSFPEKWDQVQDSSYFFSNMSGYFANDDITVVNFEGVITTSKTASYGNFGFNGKTEYLQALVDGSIEAVTLANNHTKDFGEAGLADTKENLVQTGVKTFGDEDIAYFDIRGVKVALIGINTVNSSGKGQSVGVANIAQAKEAGADIIVAYYHWGVEYSYAPTSSQRACAREAIDAGATIVVGSHPHVVQGYETYAGHPIIYSLGNFCFGGNFGPDDFDCYIYQQTIHVNPDFSIEIGTQAIVPCSISSIRSTNDYRPTPYTGDALTVAREKLERLSAAL